MQKLAINGGTPVLGEPLRPYKSMGPEEESAVVRVVRSDCLSGFYGSWGPEFLGGPEIKALEEEWSNKFRAKHSVTVNSAASGLFAAIGAVGVGPGGGLYFGYQATSIKYQSRFLRKFNLL